MGGYELYWLASGAAAGATVAAALDASREHGLARCGPQRATLGGLGPVHAADCIALPFADGEAVALHPFEHVIAGHALILGDRQSRAVSWS